MNLFHESMKNQVDEDAFAYFYVLTRKKIVRFNCLVDSFDYENFESFVNRWQKRNKTIDVNLKVIVFVRFAQDDNDNEFEIN